MAHNKLLNTGVAANMKLAINSFPLTRFDQFRDSCQISRHSGFFRQVVILTLMMAATDIYRGTKTAAGYVAATDDDKDDNVLRGCDDEKPAVDDIMGDGPPCITG